MTKYIDRVFIVSADGIENVGEGKYSGNEDTVRVLERALKLHKSVELDLRRSEYASSVRVVFFVEPNYKARANFVHLCKIADCTPKNTIYAVSHCEGLESLHRTHAGASAALKRLQDSNEINCYLSLEQIED